MTLQTGRKKDKTSIQESKLDKHMHDYFIYEWQIYTAGSLKGL